MTRIYTSVYIPQPIEAVYKYLTTPNHWPQWHPSSLGLIGLADHSLELGEQVTEKFYIAKQSGTATWTVCEREFPRLWAIKGKVGGMADAVIRYKLNPQGDGTFFEREFVYIMPNPLGVLLDWFVLRRRINAESIQALQQLKVVLTQKATLKR